jgi:hypothetical protein
MDERTIARFWSKIDVRGRNECWPWIAGSRANGGYGSFSIGRKLKHLRAHRLSWELAYGPIPDGMDVLHKCDYPPCCNPECLFLGTNLDNIRDKHAKMRHPHGETHGGAKLTNARVVRMRALRKGRRYSYDRLAVLFEVSVGCVWNACNRVTWRHVR